MQSLLAQYDRLLMEGAIVERLRRTQGTPLHPTLLNAPLIYESQAGDRLGDLYRGYLDIALAHQLPFLMCTPTWRANRERVDEAPVPPSINRDAAHFMHRIRKRYNGQQARIRIGGLIGCKNDCYRPQEALSPIAARSFHAWQIEELAAGDVDFLIAQTLPSVEEALGIAMAMADTHLPYVISFVIDRHGRILDGTPLHEAFQRIDDGTLRAPLGYMVNCAYPTFLCAEQQPAATFTRLIGYLANASSLDHCDLDQADSLEMDDLADWGTAMLMLNERHGVKILGGCCGTGTAHLDYLAASANH